MNLPKLSRNTSAQTDTQSLTANPTASTRRGNCCVIPGRLTGKKPIVLNPDAIDMITQGGGCVRVILKSGEFVTLQTATATTTMREVVSVVFGANAEGVLAMHAEIGRYVNPRAIDALENSSANSVLTLRCGQRVILGPGKHEGLLRAVYGEEIAEEYKRGVVPTVIVPPTEAQKKYDAFRESLYTTPDYKPLPQAVNE
jgi:hypothetical protein